MSMFDWIEARSRNLEEKGAWKNTGQSGFQVKLQAEKLTDSIRKELSREFIAFDTETTGLDPFFDRIIELGAVRFVDGKPAEQFSMTVNAGKKSDPSAAKVHQISQEEIDASPEEKEAYEKMQAFFGKAMQGEILLCAHNAPFDMTFLQSTLQRLQIPASLRYIDTLPLCRRQYPHSQDFRQQTIAGLLGIENEQAHRACSDAQVCGKILCCILNDRKTK